MARLVDAHCALCNRTMEVMCAPDEPLTCPLGHPMEERWWARRSKSDTVWHPSEWATVFRKPDGTFKYPGRADVPTPAGCERITIRSDAEMAQHEQIAGVRSERRWFDRGSGNGFDADSTMRTIPKPTDPELLQYLRRRPS